MGCSGAFSPTRWMQGHIVTNPAHGVRKPADGHREFRLDADRIPCPGNGLEAAEARAEPWQAVTAIRLLALTGCRKGEILKLRLSEVDLSGRCLRLGDTKTGQSMRALGEAAVRILKAAMNRPGRPLSPYVLPGRDPRKPFNGLGGAWLRIVGDGYTPHSLRHAFASASTNGPVGIDHAMLLGHASARKGSTTRGYISKPDAFCWRGRQGQSAHLASHDRRGMPRPRIDQPTRPAVDHLNRKAGVMSACHSRVGLRAKGPRRAGRRARPTVRRKPASRDRRKRLMRSSPAPGE